MSTAKVILHYNICRPSGWTRIIFIFIFFFRQLPITICEGDIVAVRQLFFYDLMYSLFQDLNKRASILLDMVWELLILYFGLTPETKC
jgi:hypothetical protein